MYRPVTALLSLALPLALLLSLAACRGGGDSPVETGFTLAVIPDTQNYTDYTRQTSEGFALDAVELFLEQMRYIADRSRARGGDVAFVAAVGDVWQHQTLEMDPEHAARGFEREFNPYLSEGLKISDKVLSFEIPRAVEGYQYLAEAGLPFGVAPGNHDYDAMWSAAGYPPNLEKSPEALTMTAEDLGILHIGGLDNFRRAFGDDQAFFAGKPWYVASHRGGTSSAQRFDAAGYRFLHIALEMSPDDEVLDWVESVLDRFAGLPTILSTHDYLDPAGERRANPIVDLARVDPEGHNSAEQLWQKLIRRKDQIFLVLCGHHHGQSLRIDLNDAGYEVYQVLADYQDRGQAGIEAGQPPSRFRGRPEGIGDGWFRMMRFDFSADPARIEVRTYSSHYGRYSGEVLEYAEWYRDLEQPGMSDIDFYAADDYTLELTDFYRRFGQD